MKAYDTGRCDSYTTDSSGLYGERLRLADPDDNIVLPEIISKEPLSPAVRQGDDSWEDLVRWVHYAMLDAEELGVTKNNVDEQLKSPNPEIRRLARRRGPVRPVAGPDQRLGLPHHQAGRQLRREFRAQCRPGLAAEDRARAQRAVDQGRPAIRPADPLRPCSPPCGHRCAPWPGRSMTADRSDRQPRLHGARSSATSLAGRAGRRRRRPRLRGRRQCRATIWRARHIASGLRLLGQYRGLRHQPDADRLFGRAPRPSAAPFGSGCSTRCWSPASASCWRPCSALSSASRGCRATGSWRGSPAAMSNSSATFRCCCSFCSGTTPCSRRCRNCATASRCPAAAFPQQSRPVPAAAAVRAGLRRCAHRSCRGGRRRVALRAMGAAPPGAHRRSGCPICWLALGLDPWTAARRLRSWPASRSHSAFRRCGRFNVTGGVEILPEFAALLLALSVYTAAFIAEVVRAGMLAGAARPDRGGAGARASRSGTTLRLIVDAAGDARHHAAADQPISQSDRRTPRSPSPSAIPIWCRSLPARCSTSPAKPSRSSPSPWRSISPSA